MNKKKIRERFIPVLTKVMTFLMMNNNLYYGILLLMKFENKMKQYESMSGSSPAC